MTTASRLLFVRNRSLFPSMSTTMQAIYENGRLTLRHPLPLPDHTHVRVTIGAEESGVPDQERAAWLKLSERSLMEAWDNRADDVFNELL